MRETQLRRSNTTDVLPLKLLELNADLVPYDLVKGTPNTTFAGCIRGALDR